MRILMINDSLGKGGKERRMLELIKGLVKNPDYNIMLVSLTDNIEYDYVYDLPIKLVVIKRKWKKDMSVIFKLYRLIKEFKPDIVHSWGSMASVFLLPAICLSRKYFVNGIIADAPQHLTTFNTTYLRKRITYPLSDVIIGNSKAGIEAYKAPLRKSICIYNGLDLGRFTNLPDPAVIKRNIIPNYDSNLFIAGMVAAFEERKDYDTLIAAAQSLVAADNRIRFVLIGNGVDFDRIKNSVPASMHDRIIFLGKRSDVEAIVNIFDAGLLLTNAKVHGEGISNSIIEYMALGKPVIATRGGGTNEVVLDGKNGYLVDAGKPADIIDKLTLLMNNSSLATTMGEYGRAMIHEQFNLACMTKQYEEIYRKPFLKEKKSS